MQTQTTRYLPAVCGGFLAMSASAAVLQRNFPIPSPSGEIDTESSSCAWMGAPDDLSRRFTLTLETVPMTNGCVQVAFGRNRNGDEDLEPEETDMVVGMDCGRWFLRDEKARLEQFEDEDATTNAVRHLFSLYQPRSQNERWTMAKVTTRGAGGEGLIVGLEWWGCPVNLVDGWACWVRGDGVDGRREARGDGPRAWAWKGLLAAEGRLDGGGVGDWVRVDEGGSAGPCGRLRRSSLRSEPTLRASLFGACRPLGHGRALA